MKANDSKVYQIFPHISPFFPIFPHIAPFSDPLDSMHAYARVDRNDNYLTTEDDIT